MKRVLVAGAAANLASLAFGSSAPDQAGTTESPNCLSENNPTLGNAYLRRARAYNLRVHAAYEEYQRPIPRHPDNEDEERFADQRYIGSYTKGLPHNARGEVDPAAYEALLYALRTGKPADFERIPLGCPEKDQMKLVNPQAGLAYDLEGADSHALYQPPAPRFGSPEENAELVELYWMALTRDIAFRHYDTHPLVQAAAADLTRLGYAFKGPKEGGQVTPQTLFRDNLPGALIGPYQSQFRYLPCMFGANEVDQRILTVLPNQDFLTDYGEWLRIQRGCFPDFTQQFDPVRRYIRNGRDAAQWVHTDVLHQAYFMAMLVLLAFPLEMDVEGGPIFAMFDPGNPYLNSRTQTGFGTFGVAHIATLLPEVTTRALKAVWFQKWFVHRRLRPEVYAGRIHNTLIGRADYPIGKSSLFQSEVLTRIKKQFGSYLLPQVFPEGSPLHPSYGAGHATVAGACVTILKAFFDEDFVIQNPVIPSANGRNLEPYTGPDADRLTVGGELNKLASNVATSRNIAGVHWRSDAIESLKLGEEVAISILRDQRRTYNEDFRGFTLTRFNGEQITV